jgi:hypothetical protein
MYAEVRFRARGVYPNHNRGQKIQSGFGKHFGSQVWLGGNIKGREACPIWGDFRGALTLRMTS